MIRTVAKKEGIFRLIVGTIIIISTVFFFTAFGTFGTLNHHLSGNRISLSWLITNFIKYFLGIFISLGWITFFREFKSDSMGKVIQFWLFILIAGWSLQFITLLFKMNYYPPAFFNQTLIITRNAFPFLTGIIIFLFVQPYLYNKFKNPALRIMFFSIAFIPLIADRDPFGFGNGTTLATALFFGLIGTLISAQKIKISPKWIVPIIGLSFLFFLGYAKLNLMRAFEISRVNRWLGITSPLTIIPAIILSNNIHQITLKYHNKKSKRISTLLSYSFIVALLLMTGDKYSELSKIIFNKIRIYTQPSVGLFWIIISSIILTGTIFLISALALFIASKTKVYRYAPQYWPNNILAEINYFSGNYQKVLRRIWNKFHYSFLTAILLFFTQILSTLLMYRSFKTLDSLSHPNNNIIIVTFFNNFPRMFAGFIVLSIFYIFLKSVSNHRWFSLISVIAFTLAFSFANRLKIASRSEPIIPADISELKSFSALIEMIGFDKLIMIIFLLILVIALIVYLEHNFKSNRYHPHRIIKVIGSGLFIISLGLLHHDFIITTPFLQALGVDPNEATNLLVLAQSNGPILQYVSGLDVTIMVQPDNYSKETINQIMDKYQKRAKTINQGRTKSLKSQTVIFNLSESFSDPANIPGLKINHNPISNIKNIEAKNTSGKMMSFGYGGGTANMEYMSLTGMSMGNFDTTLKIPYTQLVAKQEKALNIGDYFNFASAIHPYQGTFYNRQTVYQKFNFNRFSFLGSKYKIADQKKLGRSPYLSDETAYENALNQINSRSKGQFINLITIQNHFPYENDLYDDHDFNVSGHGFNNSNKEALDHYIQGIHYTDQAAEKFRQSIDKINKPIIWVFYGDHLAGLYNSTNQQKLHETEYFVYANKYARTHGAQQKITTQSKYTSASNFIALAAKQANAKVDPFLALLTDVQENLPVQWIKENNSHTNSTAGLSFIDSKKGKISFKQLTKQQKLILKEYQLIQYDITAGNQYSLTKSGSK
ncbi:MAG: sulfatase-like hydrolase/transferase [Lactobacillaceae bacterium]|nr:sulfatase-like hydrolase/transferase [Lactobacillaceae bacterium]